jgi:hypothetical protein
MEEFIGCDAHRPLPDVNRNNTTIVMPNRIIPGKISSDSSNR